MNLYNKKYDLFLIQDFFNLIWKYKTRLDLHCNSSKILDE